MNAPGKVLLKIVSILLIIFGVAAAVFAVLGLIVYAAMADSLGKLAGIIIVTIVLILVVGMLDLVLGIVGLKKCGIPAQSSYFVTSGIVLCALSLVSLIHCLAGNGFDVTIMGLPLGALAVTGTVLPVFYIIGGSKNKNAAKPVSQ